MTFRVFVVEVPDLSPQASPGDTFLFVCKNRTAVLGDGIPNGLPSHIAEAGPRPRLDICPAGKRHTADNANKLVEKTKRALRREGYKVNPEDERSLYVIEINPVEGSKPCDTELYVGQTSKTVEERFAQHVAGGRLSARPLRGKSLKLRMELAPKAKYYTESEAEAAETRLGKRLQKRGFKVCGPQDMK